PAEGVLVSARPPGAPYRAAAERGLRGPDPAVPGPHRFGGLPEPRDPRPMGLQLPGFAVRGAPGRLWGQRGAAGEAAPHEPHPAAHHRFTCNLTARRSSGGESTLELPT